MSDYLQIQNVDNGVKITILNNQDVRSLIASLQNAFDECFQNGVSNIILDFKNVQYPSTSFIALLIEATSRARRLDGDLKLINVRDTAKNNFSTFTPLSYLNIEKNHVFQINETNNLKKENKRTEKIVIDDIAETPILNKFKKQIEEKEAQIISKPAFKGHHKRVPSRPEHLYDLCDFVTEYAAQSGMSEKDIGKTKIAVYEACLNVIEHAYHSRPDHWIDVWVNFEKNRFEIVIVDYGTGFKFIPQKQYDVKAAMEGRQTGGFGLYIIRRSMDEVDYRVDPVHGNRLTMVKYIK